MSISSNRMVHIVDDDEGVRDSLELLLQVKKLPCRKYSSAEEFLHSFDSSLQGCLLLDVQMPGMTGLELQKLLQTKKIPMPVIIMTGHGDISMAVGAMKSGIYDFVEKPFNAEILLEKVHTCLIESDTLSVKQKQHQEMKAHLEQLTPRELEVAQLLVEGKSNKNIASKLNLSVRTIEVHRSKVMSKLEARSIIDIVRFFE